MVLVYLFVWYILNSTQDVKILKYLDSVQILLLNHFKLSNYLQNYGYILIKLKSTHHNILHRLLRLLRIEVSNKI